MRYYTLEEIISALKDQGYFPQRAREGGEYRAYCPCCEGVGGDGNIPHHLYITLRGDNVLMHCVKCQVSNKEILDKLRNGGDIRVVEKNSFDYKKLPTYTLRFKKVGNPYIYYDLDNREVFRKYRGKEYDRETNALIKEKSFRIYGKGGRGLRPKDCQLNIYKLPQLSATKPDDLIFIVEGEKDVRTIYELGYPAFTTYHGAKDKIPLSKFEAELLKARTNLVAISDNDEVGERYAEFWVKAYGARKISTKDLWQLEFGGECPEHMDITDYIEKGGKIETVLEQANKIEEVEGADLEKPLKEFILDNLPVEFSYDKLEFKIAYDGIYCKGVGKEEDYEKIIRNLAFPVQYKKDLDSGIEMLELYCDGAKDDRLILAPDILASKAQIVKQNKQGLKITDNKSKKAVSYFEGFEEEFKERIGLTWTTNRIKFIKNKLVGFNSPVELNNKEELQRFTPKGSAKVFIEKVFKEYWTKYPAMVFMHCFALASIINGLVKNNPLILFVHGESQAGKTPASQIIASALGNYNDNMLFTSDSTFAALREAYLNRGCIPIFLEEWEQVRSSFIRDNEDIIYKLANGQFYAKKEKDENGNWKTTSITRYYNYTMTTGEKPLLDSYARAGALNRFILLEFPKIDSNFFAKVLPICQKNYGWMLKDFLENAPLNEVADIINYGKELNLEGIEPKHITCFKSIEFALKWTNKRYGYLAGMDVAQLKKIFLKSGITAKTEAEDESYGSINLIKVFVNSNFNGFWKVWAEKDGRGTPTFFGIKGFQEIDLQNPERKLPKSPFKNFGYILYEGENGREQLEVVIKLEQVDQILKKNNLTFKGEKQDWYKSGVLTGKVRKLSTKNKDGQYYESLIYAWNERMPDGSRSMCCHFDFTNRGNNNNNTTNETDNLRAQIKELKAQIKEKDEINQGLLKEIEEKDQEITNLKLANKTNNKFEIDIEKLARGDYS